MFTFLPRCLHTDYLLCCKLAAAAAEVSRSFPSAPLPVASLLHYPHPAPKRRGGVCYPAKRSSRGQKRLVLATTVGGKSTGLMMVMHAPYMRAAST